MVLVFSFCFANYSIAQEEVDINTAIQQTTMPSDAEIMETIRKFNFDKAQEEYLFKETKRKLIEMYSNKNFSAITTGESTLSSESLNSSEVKTKKYSRNNRDIFLN